MNHATPTSLELLTRQEAAEWERQYREHLDAAVEKLDRAATPGRRRPPAFNFNELRALRQFVRKFHNT